MFPQLIILLSLLFLSGCSSEEVRRPSSSGRRVASRPRQESVIPKRQPDSRPPPQAAAPFVTSSLEAVLKAYTNTLHNLSTVTDTEQIGGLKKSLGYHLQVSEGSLSVLTNPKTGSAWFGDVVVAIGKDNSIFIIDKAGKFLNLPLKDRVVGGVYEDESGHARFLSIFFGSLLPSDRYHAYIGTQKATVIDFDMKRDENKSIVGSIRTPTGSTLSIKRVGRDNHSIFVNNKTFLTLFE